MKYQNILDELNGVIESTNHCRMKHQEILKGFLTQFKAEEEKLTRKLNESTDDESREKWEEKLGLVREAYQLLGV